MARTFVSPMGDPTFANAATSLAEALFPNARTQAAARMMGAQYRGQELGNEQTELENVGLRRSNTAYDSLSDVIVDPVTLALLRAGGGNADQLAGAVGKRQEQGFRDGAVDAARAGKWTDANAHLFGVASGPVRIDDIDSGYRLNPYDVGGTMDATSSTVADIAASYARANASNAAAGASAARAGYYNERTANPQRFLSSGGTDKPLPAGDSRLLTSEILARIPEGVGYSEADLAAAIGRAEQLRAEGLPIGTAAAQAFDETFGLDAQPTVPMREGTLWDGVFDMFGEVPAGGPRLNRLPQMIDPPPPGPAPAAAMTTSPVPSAPAAPRAVAKVPPSQYEAAIAEANKAIAAGANPADVRQRLIDMGVPLQDAQ